MKQILAILLTFAILTIISTTAIALPEGAVARLGKGMISDVQFSPEGGLLAVATSIGVWLYDTQNYDEVALLKTTSAMETIAFSPDGSILASAGRDKSIKLWDVSTRQLIDTFTGYTDEVFSVAFSPDGTVLASGDWGEITGLIINS